MRGGWKFSRGLDLDAYYTVGSTCDKFTAVPKFSTSPGLVPLIRRLSRGTRDERTAAGVRMGK